MLIKAIDIPHQDPIYQYSNPVTAQHKATKYLGPSATLYRSSHNHKKYAIVTPSGKVIHFGQMGYEDFTKHNDLDRRKNYLTRSGKIIGDWKIDKYSANNLAREILW